MPEPNLKTLVVGIIFKAGHFLRDYFGILTVGICSVIIAAISFVGLHENFDVLYKTKPGLWVSCLTVFAIIGYFTQFAQQKSREAIKGELRESERRTRALNVRLDDRHKAAANCFREHLADISRELGFSNAERISVYLVRVEDARFRIVGRFAANGNYDDVHRQVHEADQGITAKVYADGKPFWFDFKNDPFVDHAAYCREHFEEFHVAAEIASSFKMRSRSYLGFPVLDANGTRCIAAVICESTEFGRMTRLNSRFKIIDALERSSHNIRIFVQSADPGDDYVLQSQKSERQHKKGKRRES